MLNQLKKHQIFWNIAAKVYKFAPYRYFKKLPKAIFIEITNACNLRCPVCPTHFAMKRERGFMELALFKSIIDEFRESKVKPEIFMHFAGEPLLHKDIDKMVEYASGNGHKTYISTNATVLTADLSEKLIKAGLYSVHLCLDGIKKESHETYRVGSNFETVKKNIEDFLVAKKELNEKNPLVCIQTLLTSFSENERDKIVAWAKDIGADFINFKSFTMGSFTTKEQKEKYAYLLPKRKGLQRKVSGIHKTLCSWPRDNAVVYWNGNLGLCCIDFDNEIKMPNIKERGLINTFTSEEVINRRRLGFQKKYNLCKRCSLGDADFMSMGIKLN